MLLSSFTMLFVELALIRWLGSNVVYLSYFSNFVLMGSFLGIGLGFLRAKARPDLFSWSLVILAFLAGLVFVFPVTIDRTGSQLIYFGGEIAGAPIWLILPGIFLAVAAVMAAIAQGVARTFVLFEPLEAYRLDILGSIGGIVAFSLLSFLGAPPIVWGAVAACCLLALHAPGIRAVQVIAALGLLIVLGRESFHPGYSWSPYYKVQEIAVAPGLTAIDVNGVPHQIMASVKWHRAVIPIYFAPYARLNHNPLDDVLIVGAGSGSDVAIALAEGAKHVDAVEIDPRIYEIGRRQNPDHPYQDPRVSIHIGDGRAFLRQARSRYDLVLFALPDSLALVSPNSSLRLESYLFTSESLRAARDLLKPKGVFSMYNFYREDWLVDRYANTMRSVFGSAPCVDVLDKGGKFAVLVAGRTPGGVKCGRRWRPTAFPAPDPSTDDHPFPYLRTAAIPPVYLLTLALILIAAVVLVRVSGGPLQGMQRYLDLFFMGSAFLLLETKNVVQFALLFGTTWFVNALVFFGILVAVLAAIEVARRFPLRRSGVTYLILFATLAVAWLVDPQWLLSLDLPLRVIAATSLAFAPIFVANLVFAQRFRGVGSSTTAFATNLLGAMVGGTLEYASLVVGYRSLLIVVAVLYGLAFLCGRTETTGDVEPAPAQRPVATES